ncbi:MAG: TA system VapC family ribonuclease toxin [Terriglobales bacterium]
MRKAISELLLLDVNVLLAVAWPQHVFHELARPRFRRAERWASCSLTQLSFVRLSATVEYAHEPATLLTAAAMFEGLTSDGRHQHLEAMPSAFRIGINFGRLHGPGQVTDAYLMALARHYGATLLTLDRRMLSLAGPGELELLTP